MTRVAAFSIIAALGLVVAGQPSKSAPPKAPKGCQAYMEWALQDHYKGDMQTAQRRAAGSAMAPNHNGKLPAGGLYYVMETTGKGEGDLVAIRISDDVMIDTTDPRFPVIRARKK